MWVYYLSTSYNKYIKHVTAYGLHWTALRAAAYVGVMACHDQKLKACIVQNATRLIFAVNPIK
jgi:hypothetical protein